MGKFGLGKLAIVKTSKPNYTACSFTKHKKGILNSMFKNNFDTERKSHQRMYSNGSPGAINLVLDAITCLSSSAVTSLHENH
jgi:hypothetical protein